MDNRILRTVSSNNHGTVDLEGRTLLKVEEAAASMGLSRTVVYDLLNSGELGRVKIGRSTRVPVDSIRAFIDRNMRKSA